MKKQKLNKPLLVSLILGLLYLIYLVSHLNGASSSSSNTERVATGLFTVILFPHIICTFLAVIFNGLGLFLRKYGFALTGGILYSVAIALFMPYFMFVIIQLVLSFVGASQIKKAQLDTTNGVNNT